ncbi:MAG: hypothetical protein HYY93_08880 [Planctomycetes bacterium]|nr:hypothetical protein [Planctomycetota bacterium]
MRGSFLLSGLLLAVLTGAAGRVHADDFHLADPKATGIQGDEIVLVPKALDGPALVRLAEHRKKRGMQVRIIVAEDAIAAYEEGRMPAEKIQLAIVNAARTWLDPKPQYVLLIGDAASPKTLKTPAPVLPAWPCSTDSGGPASVTDNNYGCIDSDDLPDLAVGRLPVHDLAALDLLVNRIIAYENDSTPGAWRKQVHFITGKGNFSPLVDNKIEEIFTGLVSDRIPYGYDVSCTYAHPGSPYCYVYDKLAGRVLELLNGGCLFYTYVGHGNVDSFDHLYTNEKEYPILDSATSVPKVNVKTGPPIMMVIACDTGRYDSPDADCIAEHLLAVKNGPVAVIAGSRVTNPYSNAVFGKVLIDGFMGEPSPTVGQALLAAKKAVNAADDAWRNELDGQLKSLKETLGDQFRFINVEKMEAYRKEQVQLYNLLGDPALTIRRPAGEVKMEVTGTVTPGGTLEVKGTIEGMKSGTVDLSLECERKVLLYPIADVSDPSSPKSAPALLKNYANANNKSLKKAAKVKVVDGAFTARIPVPGSLPGSGKVLPGKYWVKAYAASADTDAMGAVSIDLVEKGSSR